VFTRERFGNLCDGMAYAALTNDPGVALLFAMEIAHYEQLS